MLEAPTTPPNPNSPVSGDITPLNTSLAITRAVSYTHQIGLVYLGDAWLKAALDDAQRLGFTQEQFDTAFRHHAWQVRHLFSPQSYSFLQRVVMALYFLAGKFKG